MDILLDGSGDLRISENGDIYIGESVAQKIRIMLLWFEGEWKWDPEEGLPYLDELFVKDPDTDAVESMIREKIFEVDEVTEVKDVELSYDPMARKAVVYYEAMTDYEDIRGEVVLDV